MPDRDVRTIRDLIFISTRRLSQNVPLSRVTLLALNVSITASSRKRSVNFGTE